MKLNSEHLMPAAEPPLLAALSLSTSKCDVNDYVQLTCIASRGATPIRFEWRLNERPLHDDDEDTDATQATVGEHTSLLLINKAQAHHAGNYSCRASNHVGVAQRHALLTVNGKCGKMLGEKTQRFFFSSLLSSIIQCSLDFLVSFDIFLNIDQQLFNEFAIEVYRYHLL